MPVLRIVGAVRSDGLDPPGEVRGGTFAAIEEKSQRVMMTRLGVETIRNRDWDVFGKLWDEGERRSRRPDYEGAA